MLTIITFLSVLENYNNQEQKNIKVNEIAIGKKYLEKII